MLGLVRCLFYSMRGEVGDRILLGCEQDWHASVAPDLCQGRLVWQSAAQELWSNILFDLVNVMEPLKLLLDLRAKEDVSWLSFLEFESQGALVISVEGCHAHVVCLLKIQIGLSDDL